jgi:membrane protein YdbS with pleckstrin-like domain
VVQRVVRESQERAGTLGPVPVDRELLSEEEEVLVDLRPHWLFFFGPAALSVLAAVAAIAVVTVFPNAPVGVPVALAVMVAIPCVWLTGRLLRWRGISLVVTTQRLLLRRGVLGRELTQLRLQRISEVHCQQRWYGRIVGAGSLVIDVIGAPDPVFLDDVRHPRSLQAVLSGQLDQLSGREGFPPPAPSPSFASSPTSSPLPPRPDDTPPHGVSLGFGSSAPPVARSEVSIPEQLIQLDDLRRRGIINEEEFAQKKAELLSRL